MFFTRFYRSLTGTDDTTQREEERLRKNLNGMAKTNRDLDRLDAVLADIMRRVDHHEEKQRKSLPSGVSGEHKLHWSQFPEITDGRDDAKKGP